MTQEAPVDGPTGASCVMVFTQLRISPISPTGGTCTTRSALL